MKQEIRLKMNVLTEGLVIWTKESFRFEVSVKMTFVCATIKELSHNYSRHCCFQILIQENLYLSFDRWFENQRCCLQGCVFLTL